MNGRGMALLAAGLVSCAAGLLPGLPSYAALPLCGAGALLLFLSAIEGRAIGAELLVMVALLSALAAAGRMMFVPLANIQPSSFLILLSGMVLGGRAGIMTGVLTALLSGFTLGLGPYTPWQMLAWGLVGLSAGLLGRPLRRRVWLRLLLGAFWGYGFGAVTNLWFIGSGLAAGGTWLAAMAASFPFDTMHAASNVVFMLALGGPMLRVLDRVAEKYGLR